MTDIPDDIMQRARSILDAINFAIAWSPRGYREYIARALIESEARGYERAKEQAAKVADAASSSADRKFAGVIKRHRKGERNLELAASTAAGMDHEARKIAAAIRNMRDNADE
jgi:hypothetical protein